LAVYDQVCAGIARGQVAYRLRCLALDVLEQRDRHLERKGQVELAGDEGEDRRRTVRYYRVFDPVEIRPSLLPVIGVARHHDPFVWLEFDKFERAGADWMRAHIARRDVARINRCVARGEQGDQPGLRPLQNKRRLVIAVGRDRLDVAVPGFARVEAELL